jgi:hypothetical protein
MDHCVITAFKLYCLRRAFSRFITAISIEEGTGLYNLRLHQDYTRCME